MTEVCPHDRRTSTLEKPACFNASISWLKVNGISLIERLLNQIKKQDSVERIIIVIGYKGDELKEYISSLNIDIPITYIEKLSQKTEETIENKEFEVLVPAKK